MSNKEITDAVAEYELRGIPIEELLAREPSESTLKPLMPSMRAAPMGPVRYAVDPQGEPQASGTKFYVTDLDTSERFYVGYVQLYGSSRRGIARYVETNLYDRFKAEAAIGVWAHFMYPSIMAESSGRQISINAWDRAHFTWGFYQLAAHTAGDNLILLMRELVQLPSAKRYFPDLLLANGKLARQTGIGPVTLEREVEVPVASWTETQLPDFMAYLNPNSRRLDEAEVVTSAKFIAWAQEDPAMLETTLRVSNRIMQRKIRNRASQLNLFGKRPELAIWVSDIFHQGRGTVAMVRNALNEPTFSRQLQALFEIDSDGSFLSRRKTVRQYVQVLLDERRFDGVPFGEGALDLSTA